MIGILGVREGWCAMMRVSVGVGRVGITRLIVGAVASSWWHSPPGSQSALPDGTQDCIVSASYGGLGLFETV